MHILFLAQVLPYPPHAGPKVRAYHVLRYLAQHHKVTLLSFVRGDEAPEHLDHLRGICREVYTVPIRRSHARDMGFLMLSLLSGQSFIIRRDWVPAMARRVRELLGTGEYDILHADQLWMAQYALLSQSGSWRKKPKLILDEHNACYLIPQRMAEGERNLLKRVLLAREWRALARYEAQACSRFDHVVTVTDEDQQALKSQIAKLGAPLPQFATIPICVDAEETKLIRQRPGVKNIIYVGTMFYPPNIDGVLWFVQEVFPLVRQAIPEIKFYIVGKNPAVEIRRLPERHGDALVVTGYIEDLKPYLADSAAFVVPLRAGGGMRVKILDAWAQGIPIVATTVGCEGIEVQNGDNILVADDPAAFATAVTRIIAEPDLAAHLRASGRRWVEERYDWRRVYGQWEKVYVA